MITHSVSFESATENVLHTLAGIVALPRGLDLLIR